jgi:hypothetical protein
VRAALLGPCLHVDVAQLHAREGFYATEVPAPALWPWRLGWVATPSEQDPNGPLTAAEWPATGVMVGGRPAAGEPKTAWAGPPQHASGSDSPAEALEAVGLRE